MCSDHDQAPPLAHPLSSVYRVQSDPFENLPKSQHLRWHTGALAIYHFPKLLSVLHPTLVFIHSYALLHLKCRSPGSKLSDFHSLCLGRAPEFANWCFSYIWCTTLEKHCSTASLLQVAGLSCAHPTPWPCGPQCSLSSCRYDFTCAVPLAWNVFHILLSLLGGFTIFQDPAQDSLCLTYSNEVNPSFGPPLC